MEMGASSKPSTAVLMGKGGARKRREGDQGEPEGAWTLRGNGGLIEAQHSGFDGERRRKETAGGQPGGARRSVDFAGKWGPWQSPAQRVCWRRGSGLCDDVAMTLRCWNMVCIFSICRNSNSRSNYIGIYPQRFLELPLAIPGIVPIAPLHGLLLGGLGLALGRCGEPGPAAVIQK